MFGHVPKTINTSSKRGACPNYLRSLLSCTLQKQSPECGTSGATYSADVDPPMSRTRFCCCCFCFFVFADCSQGTTKLFDGRTSSLDGVAHGANGAELERPEAPRLELPGAPPLAGEECEFEEDRDSRMNSWPVVRLSERGRLPNLPEMVDDSEREQKYPDAFSQYTSSDHWRRRQPFFPSTRRPRVHRSSSNYSSSSSSSDGHRHEGFI